MNAAPASPWTPARDADLRAPGLHFVEALRQRPMLARPAHGVPLFVGRGRARQGGPRATRPLEVAGWAQFRDAVEPARDGFLAPAVAGFFVNGGRLCRVLPLDVDRRDASVALARAFAAGGPLEDVAGIDLVCVPDAAVPLDGAPDADADVALRDAQAAVLAHCESMGERFAILDAAPGPARQAGDGDAVTGDAARLDAVVTQSQWRRSRFGALYFPWLWVADAGAAAPRRVPPCGHVAGLYARTDARTGVHKAPANETLHGVAALDLALGRAAHGRLNDAGVNCILGATASGLRVWGARTLSGQPDWRHVPVSRLFAALAGWLRHGTEDLVFEPHTPELWRRMRRRLGAHCLDLMHAGALASSDPERAFFVRCDAGNNPGGDRDAGRLIADVGLAPTTPAEFVVVRITQGAGGFAMTGGA
jgi:hypothetical protein